MIANIFCTNCGTPYPDGVPAYKCPKCGGIFDFKPFPEYDPAQVDPAQPGLWRYRHAFGLPAEFPAVSLGEGNTPLVPAATAFGDVCFKLEFLNPTGSHKDRGVSLMTSVLSGMDIEEAVEDSSGNAGASFAAYAARAGIRAQIFVPDYASGPKRKQIAAYGAEVLPIPGARSDVAAAVRQAADEGAVYASHAYLPHLLPGFATLAYEVTEQLGRAPAAVVAPVGQGSLLLGIGRGFRNLKAAGLIEEVPRLIGVQAMACAPIWAVYNMGAAGMQWVTEGETAAEGVRVRYPHWGDAVMQTVLESRGLILAVDEPAVLSGRDELARLGLYVEPTSAIVWDALRQMQETGWTFDADRPTVAVLTGSGLKSNL